MKKKEITKDDKNYNKVMAIADLYALYLEKIATQGEGLSSENKEAWNNYIRDTYKNCPAIQLFLKDKETLYSEEFWNIINNKK